eukprot:COSAG02_NODE_663_length_18741_cov_9.083682_16_plen_67_part_00
MVAYGYSHVHSNTVSWACKQENMYLLCPTSYKTMVQGPAAPTPPYAQYIERHTIPFFKNGIVWRTA